MKSKIVDIIPVVLKAISCILIVMIYIQLFRTESLTTDVRQETLRSKEHVVDSKMPSDDLRIVQKEINRAIEIQAVLIEGSRKKISVFVMLLAMVTIIGIMMDIFVGRRLG